MLKAVLLCCSISFVIVSCEQEDTLNEMEASAVAGSKGRGKPVDLNGAVQAKAAEVAANSTIACTTDKLNNELLQALAGRTAVEPSACGPTALDYAIVPYVLQFGDLEWEWYDLLATINQLHSYLDRSQQYFAVDGHLTEFAIKNKRMLEEFWGMPNEVSLKGQHTKTLLNRNAIANVYLNFSTATEAEAFEMADLLISEVMLKSKVLSNSPLLSLDGFATTSNIIVIGDGIIQILNEAGTAEKETFAGVLSHEWAHQVQFNNFKSWYGVPAELSENSPEATRLTELEADFFTGYYLTHKRGGTYNWKSTAQFVHMFYNIGDCAFESDGHHGTPNQRMAAARLGWVVAQVTYPMGHIYSASEVHSLFIAAYTDIIENSIDRTEAYASLNSADLKNMYTKILGYEKELAAIASGSLDQTSIENL
ncbi:hypothetical protein WG947_01215 [Pontibacter sp. H259]|uniref:hypothetical protein n=1 Tax=Pontibacter sp. H259 TaxID=3133421 RepID=UPI0030C44AB3